MSRHVRWRFLLHVEWKLVHQESASANNQCHYLILAAGVAEVSNLPKGTRSVRLDNPGFFDFIAANYRRHGRSEKFWSDADAELATDKPRIRDELERGEVSLGALGPVCFDYVEMGAINSLDLLGLDELILLSFYWINRNRYRRVGDLGANLGLHSIFLGLLDIRVTAYEPDPSHLVDDSRILVFFDALGSSGRCNQGC